jgi:hypothetical protein
MMAAEQRAEALAHSDACENCAARLGNEEMLTRGLQTLAAEMKTMAAPPELEHKLLEAFRTRDAVAPASRRQSNSRYWLAAVAAVLLIVMSVVAVRWRAAVDTPQQAITKVEQPKKVQLKKPVEEQVVENQTEDLTPRREIVRTPSRRSRKPYNPQVANHVRNEIATDFIPLGYMNAAHFQDGGRIVRVELPRSALANFGLPVNMDRYHEKVKADVLYGTDGLAHAIRFVQ